MFVNLIQHSFLIIIDKLLLNYKMRFKKLKFVTNSNNISGRFLVNFKKAEKNIYGVSMPNDLMPATVEPYKNRLYIKWDNGYTATISHEHCNFSIMKAIFKFNNGQGAILCSKCSVIIKTGKEMTEEEVKAMKGEIHLDPQHCKNCK